MRPQTPFVNKDGPIISLYTPRMEGVTVYSGVLCCSQAKGQYKMLSRNSFHHAKHYETDSQRRVVRSNYREAVIEWVVICIIKLKTAHYVSCQYNVLEAHTVIRCRVPCGHGTSAVFYNLTPVPC